MKIVPLDKQGKYLIEKFLELVPQFDTTRMLYTTLHSIAQKTGNPKFAKTKNVSNKIKRLFTDIYKRICLKLSKRKGINITLNQQMEEKIGILIRHYPNLTTRQIFLKICHRYVGHLQQGQVTQDQEIQFYEEINRKIFNNANLKKQVVNFQEDQWHEDDNPHRKNKQKIIIFARSQFQQSESEQQYNPKKNQKNWDKQIQKQIKKVQQQVQKAKVERQHEENSQQKLQNNSDLNDQQRQRIKNLKKQTLSDDESQGKQTESQQQESKQQKIKRQTKAKVQNFKNQKKQAKNQEVKKSKHQLKMQKRKIVKAKGPKDNTPTQIKGDEQIWSEDTYKKLCKQFLLQQNCLMNLAKQFSEKQNINPVISVKQLSEKLIYIMQKSFKTYTGICQRNYKKKFQISQITMYDQRYLESYLKSSSATVVRKKLIRFYLNFQDPEFQLKQKQAYEVFLHLKEGLKAIMERIQEDQQNYCDEDELLNLLAEGQFNLAQQNDHQLEQIQQRQQKDKKNGKKSPEREKGPIERYTQEINNMKFGRKGPKKNK